jgi:hypothetical protein
MLHCPPIIACEKPLGQGDFFPDFSPVVIPPPAAGPESRRFFTGNLHKLWLTDLLYHIIMLPLQIL